MKLGIVLNDLGMNQAAFMAISYVNTILQIPQFKNEDISFFYCNNVPVIIKPLASYVNVDKIFRFDGTLIANDIYTASLISKSTAKKILYIWDLEWMWRPEYYISNLDILKSNDFTVLCRSEYHAKVIENYCGVKPAVVPNFNLIKIIEDLRNENI